MSLNYQRFTSKTGLDGAWVFCDILRMHTSDYRIFLYCSREIPLGQLSQLEDSYLLVSCFNTNRTVEALGFCKREDVNDLIRSKNRPRTIEKILSRIYETVSSFQDIWPEGFWNSFWDERDLVLAGSV